jgi:hypothetical protein
MRPHIAVVVLPLAGLMAGCDPAAGVTTRQRLAPATQLDCVRAALAASPVVREVGPSTYYKALPGYQFQVLLRDSIAPPHVIPPHVRLVVPAHDSVTLEVSVSYFGATTGSITPESARQLAAAAGVLTRLVREACVPDAAAPTCRVEGFGRSRPCALSKRDDG